MDDICLRLIFAANHFAPLWYLYLRVCCSFFLVDTTDIATIYQFVSMQDCICSLLFTHQLIAWKWSTYSYTIHESLMTQAWMIQEQRVLMKLTGVCGHFCLMYRCSPHRISWMLHGGYWVLSVFLISTTNLHNSSHSLSLLSVSRLISVRFDSSICSLALAHSLLSFRAQQFDTLVFFGWNPLASFSKSSSLREKSKRLSEELAEYFLLFNKRALPLAWAILGWREWH